MEPIDVRKEVYISVDLEASGLIPGDYSMLSIGACLVNNIEENFYVEIIPLNDNFIQEAIDVCGLNMKDLFKTGIKPKIAMQQFRDWILKVVGDIKKNRPVFVGFAGYFDWMFTQWYFEHFLGPKSNPFGWTGIEMKSYWMGKKNTILGNTVKRKLSKELMKDLVHTHNALDDAENQAILFKRMLEADCG